MSIEAKIIADSTGHKSKRLITFQLRYPRFIHAELMTHRQFSRNASSSRAIPVERMIADIIDDTAMPIHWGKNQPGMQAHEENDAMVILQDGDYHATAEQAWRFAMGKAVEVAEAFNAAGFHKQVVNRILEPFMHISVVVTSSNFDNFYWLRRHKDAQPEIKALADAMWVAQQASTPKLLDAGQWHLPYVTEDDYMALRTMDDDILRAAGISYSDPEMGEIDAMRRISVARCARVSYLTHDGKKPSIANDFALYDRLVGSVPLHASPTEHQATPDEQVWSEHDIAIWEHPYLSGNLDDGWIQYRKTLQDEVCNDYAGE
ncbi:thymidylate synthase [Ruegeria phage vB_RpoS-V10]|nr:thymidylate synthase [Roseobacter phage DSS3P8]AWY09191.1 thymidylate synthase [Ruegeria phage vB_RpoS-V10]